MPTKAGKRTLHVFCSTSGAHLSFMPSLPSPIGADGILGRLAPKDLGVDRDAADTAIGRGFGYVSANHRDGELPILATNVGETASEVLVEDEGTFAALAT